MATAAVQRVESAGERLRRLLTVYEQQALMAVAEALGSQTEGVVCGARIADANGCTRSTLVSALRLAEAAGVLVARSLGTKGTHIWVLDPEALREALAPGNARMW